MAQVIQKEFRRDMGCVLVTIEDDFGDKHIHPIYFQKAQCPTCLTPYVHDGEQIDIDATAAKLVEKHEQGADFFISFAEKNGLDVAKVKAKRQEKKNGAGATGNAAGVTQPAGADGGTPPQG